VQTDIALNAEIRRRKNLGNLMAPLNQDPEIKAAFAGLWDSINAKRGYGWNTSPYVWVVEFEKQ
jgi:hypothetical protein